MAGAAPLDDDQRFDDAVKKLRALDYEAAVRAFEALAAEPRPDAERARLLVWDGAARALLGDDGAARLCFESAVRLDDSVRLEADTSPKIVAMFESVRDATLARERGGSSTTRPAGTLRERGADDGGAGPGPDRVDDGARGPPDNGARGGRDETARGIGTASSVRANDDGPPLLPVVASVASGVAAIGLAAVAGFVLYDVDGKVRTASDPTTSQAAAASLVDEANAGLWVGSTLGVVAAVLAGAAVVGAVVAFGPGPTEAQP